MLKRLLLTCLFFYCFNAISQESPAFVQFWDQLSQHCGMAYAGEVTTEPVPKDFKDQKLLMHVISCEDSVMKIPFIVGENRSRTWVFTLRNEGIRLKHDHRHEDGSEDDITQYGGDTPNTGFSGLQYFPADQETADLIPYAAGNVWWVTISDSTFTYNLRRVNNDSHITVEFDLTKAVEVPKAPWGWEE